MNKPSGADKVARQKFARALARSVFGRFYLNERDMAELKEDARKRTKRRPRD
jgi:hypothetical protein